MIRAGVRSLGGDVALYGLALLAVLLAGTAAARAETLVFRNDSNGPVVVQATAVFRGVFRRDRPYLLRPGDATVPGVVLPGDKIITIYDANASGRILFQGALPADLLDRHFGIIPVPPSGARVRLRAISAP